MNYRKKDQIVDLQLYLALAEIYRQDLEALEDLASTNPKTTNIEKQLEKLKWSTKIIREKMETYSWALNNDKYS
tara:strand:- start:83 stop:304 length:222 start_codon:yes stop_codon:yes gene_type:complete